MPRPKATPSRLISGVNTKQPDSRSQSPKRWPRAALLVELVGLVAEQLFQEARGQVMPGIVRLADLNDPRLYQPSVPKREIRLYAVPLHIELLQRALDPQPLQ